MLRSVQMILWADCDLIVEEADAERAASTGTLFLCLDSEEPRMTIRVFHRELSNNGIRRCYQLHALSGGNMPVLNSICIRGGMRIVPFHFVFLGRIAGMLRLTYSLN